MKVILGVLQSEVGTAGNLASFQNEKYQKSQTIVHVKDAPYLEHGPTRHTALNELMALNQRCFKVVSTLY